MENKSNHTAIVIDDEASGRENLCNLLGVFCPEIQVVGNAGTVAEACILAKTATPELVFLDIQLQGETGFDFLKAVDRVSFEVIFTTAYNQYAIQAIRFSALDYLLKPIDPDDLVAAVQRFRDILPATDATARYSLLTENLSRLNNQLQTLVLPTREGFEVVELKNILCCLADRNYTWVHFADGRKSLVSRTLKDFDSMLSESGFFRAHHSSLINVAHVRKYHRGTAGHVEMSDGRTIALSKRRKDDFVKLFIPG